MRVLVTGANGFVGPWLTAELAAHGHTVVATGMVGGIMPHAEHGRLVPADLTDPSAVDSLLASAKPNAIVHLAGMSHVPDCWERPAEALETNTVATTRLFASAARHGARRFLMVSSSDVYGIVRPEELPLRETSPLRPASPYAVTKLASEFMLQSLSRTHPLELVIARAFTHTGPGQTTRFVCPSFAEQVARVADGLAEEVRHGDLSARRDILDVRDVVRAYRMMLEAPVAGRIFNVCRGESVPMSEVLAQLMRLAHVHPEHARLDAARLRPVDLPELRGAPDALREATGWAPEIPLAQTLAELLATFRRAAVAAR